VRLLRHAVARLSTDSILSAAAQDKRAKEIAKAMTNGSDRL